MSRHHKRRKRFTPKFRTIVENVPKFLPPGNYSVTLKSIEMINGVIVQSFNFNDFVVDKSVKAE